MPVFNDDGFGCSIRVTKKHFLQLLQEVFFCLALFSLKLWTC